MRRAFVPIFAAVACFASISFFRVRAAHAENPLSVVVAPRAVDLLPSASSATQIVIHGTISFYKTSEHGWPEYQPPYCGYLYFECPAGSEAACRKSWSTIAAAIGKSTCIGFGKASFIPDAIIRNEDTPLVLPDPFDATTAPETITSFGDCPTQHKMTCDPPKPSVGDEDAGSTGDETGTTPPGSTPPGTSGTPGGKDAGSGSASPETSGKEDAAGIRCDLVHTRASGDAASTLILVGLVAAWSTRRRSRS